MRKDWIPAVLLVVLLCLVLHAGAAEPIDPLRYVPSDATGVLFVNARELGDMGALSRVVDIISEATRSGQILRDAVTQGKVDVDKDIDALLIVLSEAAPCSAACGRFDSRAYHRYAEQAIKDKPDCRQTYRGYPLFRNSDMMWRALLDGRIEIGGPTAHVRKLIDIHKGKAVPMAQDAPLLARTQDLRDKTIWFVMNPRVAAQPAKDANRKTGALSLLLGSIDPSTIKSVTAWSSVTREAVALHGQFECDSPESAAVVRTTLRSDVNIIGGFFSAMGSNNPAVNRAARDLVSAIRIGGAGATATVDATAKASLISTLGDAIMQWANRPR